MAISLKLFFMVLATSLLSLATHSVLNFNFYRELKEDEIRFEILKRTHDLVVKATQHAGEAPEESGFLKKSFLKEDWINSFLVSQDGVILLGPYGVGENINQVFSKAALNLINKGSLAEAAFKTSSFGDLYAYSFAPQKPYWVLSFASSLVINRPYLFYLIRTGVGFLIILSFLWMISRLTSKRVVTDIEDLKRSMEIFGTGDLLIRAKIRTLDEVGKLGLEFNKMADQIKHLVQEQKTKVRMEVELQAAQRVQEYFFPNRVSVQEHFKIYGFYEPASECGGDWWFYHYENEKLVVCIGDVTGHGSASAMLTSSCRSVFALLMQNKVFGPKDILAGLNEAIYATVRGDLTMTMAVYSFDFSKQIMFFANASHEPVLVWDKKNPPKKPNQFEAMSETHGPRLGERPGFVYRQGEIPIKTGQIYFFNSDGILELKNPEGEKLSEREMLKLLLESAQKPSLESGQEHFIKGLAAYRKGQDLVDDLSFIFLEV